MRTIRYAHHDSETDLSVEETNLTVETREYSDGFGRLIQTRTQASAECFGDEIFGNKVLTAKQGSAADTQPVTGRRNTDTANPNVIVSGWQIYDNKGRVVEKYEPFFDRGWEFDEPAGAKLGQKVTMYYDPRGQVIRTVNPDGSEQRVIYGIPADLTDLTRYTPTPWEAYTYDANDNAGRTHPNDSLSYKQHWNTPASIVIDVLGRTISATVRNGPDDQQDWYTTRSTYDIRSNLLTVTDPLERVAFTHIYDLANRPLYVHSIDAGKRHTVLDALGSPVEQRDSKGAIALHAYDMLNRPIRLWARDNATENVTLRERLVYGDGGTPDQDAAERAANRDLNRLGKLSRHDDEAGRLTFERYDFKGNLLEKLRQVIADAAILGAPSFRVDWDGAGMALAGQEYRTSTTYDAFNRVKQLSYPQNATGTRKVLRPTYNRAGALEQVRLDDAVYVERIAYNAKGQRTLIAYGNGVLTRYAYDDTTFRLARLRTEHYNADGLTYQPHGAVLQDLAYHYDLSGNILSINDQTPECGVGGSAELKREFSYDSIYRLLSASGREAVPPPDPKPWDERFRSYDVTETRAYTETYAYDKAGNIAQIARTTGPTRRFTLATGSNRLQKLDVGQTPYDYEYDNNGNMTRETLARHFEWDYADRTRAFRCEDCHGHASVDARYLYDAGGQRVKKLVEKGGTVEVTIYIDSIFEHHLELKRADYSVARANNTLHIMDNQSRIALLRVGPAFPDDATPALKYHLGDHLGCSSLVISGDGGFINREEYYPYGETSFGSFARKRYRFTGKERDEESGLNYHGARYYAPWLGRWTTADPLGLRSGLNMYTYVRNHPLSLTDPFGMSESKGPAVLPSGNYEFADSVANDLRATARAGSEKNLSECVKSGWYNWQALADERFERDQMVEFSEQGFRPERYIEERLASPVRFSHGEALASSPQLGADWRLGTPTDESGHFFGDHAGNWEKDPSVFGGANWEVDPEAEAMFGEGSNLSIVSDEEDLGMTGGEPTNNTGETGSADAESALALGLGVVAGVGVNKAIEAIVPEKHQDTAKALAAVAVPAAAQMVKQLGVRGAAVATRVAVAQVSEAVIAAAPAVVPLALAGAGGYAVGTAINSQLSEETQMAIGGTINEIVERGWVNVRDFYFGWAFK